jgi:hypothetical protein
MNVKLFKNGIRPKNFRTGIVLMALKNVCTGDIINVSTHNLGPIPPLHPLIGDAKLQNTLLSPCPTGEKRIAVKEL